MGLLELSEDSTLARTGTAAFVSHNLDNFSQPLSRIGATHKVEKLHNVRDRLADKAQAGASKRMHGWIQLLLNALEYYCHVLRRHRKQEGTKEAFPNWTCHDSDKIATTMFESDTAICLCDIA